MKGGAMLKPIFKNKKDRLLSIGIIIIMYIIVSIMTSMRIEKMIDRSYDNLGQENPYLFAISDEEFKDLGDRHGYKPEMEGNPRYTEEYFRTPVRTVHCFIATISYYTYTYELREDGVCIHGSWGIPVAVLSVMGRVVAVYEGP